MIRRPLPLLPWLLLSTVLMLAACSERDRPLDSPVRLEGSIFGSFYQVTIVDSLTQGEANELEEGILAELEAVDASMSIYRDDSELSAFNQAPTGSGSRSPTLWSRCWPSVARWPRPATGPST